MNKLPLVFLCLLLCGCVDSTYDSVTRTTQDKIVIFPTNTASSYFQEKSGVNKGPEEGRKKTPGQPDNPEQDFKLSVHDHSIDIILGRPTNNSITISLLSYVSQSVSVAYGKESGIYTGSVGPFILEPMIPYDVILVDLDANTRYYYQVLDEEYTFQTARSQGEAFTFVVQADSHLDSNTDSSIYMQTLLNEKSDSPDFLIDLGDTFMTEKYSTYTDAESQYVAQRYYLSTAANSASLYLVLGNHDGENLRRSGDEEISEWSREMRTKYFPNPIPDQFYSGNEKLIDKSNYYQDYYSWNWGDALFIVLDPYWYTLPMQRDSEMWNMTLGDNQYNWLISTLEKSNAKWKFVFIHQLVGGRDQNGRGGVEVANLYEWGGYDQSGNYEFSSMRSGWKEPIQKILVDNQVTAVFHGHDHLYAKQELDGIIYQCVPQPGTKGSFDETKAQEYGYTTGVIFGGSGYIRVKVSGESVVIDYIKTLYPSNQDEISSNKTIEFSYEIR